MAKPLETVNVGSLMALLEAFFNILNDSFKLAMPQVLWTLPPICTLHSAGRQPLSVTHKRRHNSAFVELPILTLNLAQPALRILI